MSEVKAEKGDFFQRFLKVAAVIAGIGGVMAFLDARYVRPALEIEQIKTSISLEIKERERMYDEINRRLRIVEESLSKLSSTQRDRIYENERRISNLISQYEKDQIILNNKLDNINRLTDPGDEEVLRIIQSRLNNLVERLRGLKKEVDELHQALDRLERRK